MAVLEFAAFDFLPAKAVVHWRNHPGWDEHIRNHYLQYLRLEGQLRPIGIKRFDFVGHLGLQGLFSKFLFQTN
jgi:hypothetical protein